MEEAVENSRPLPLGDVRGWRGEPARPSGVGAAALERRGMEHRKPGVRATVESLIEAWRSGDALRAAAHFAAGGCYREAGGASLSGREALTAHFTRFFRDGPRWRLEVDDLLVDDARACVVYRFAVEGEGGMWRERAGCAVATLDLDGAVAEWREYEG